MHCTPIASVKLKSQYAACPDDFHAAAQDDLGWNGVGYHNPEVSQMARRRDIQAPLIILKKND